jgi:hypothetical protein
VPTVDEVLPIGTATVSLSVELLVVELTSEMVAACELPTPAKAPAAKTAELRMT